MFSGKSGISGRYYLDIPQEERYMTRGNGSIVTRIEGKMVGTKGES